MIFTLDALPAHKGDCLVLHYGDAAPGRLVVIDGGPADTYHPHLKPHLEALRAPRNLQPHQGLPIEVLMVSHVDDDHINGLLEMSEELRDAKEAQQPLVWDVKTLWHNGFDDIIGNSQIGTAVGNTPTAALADIGHDESLILASVRQGRELRKDADVLGWTKNSSLGDILSVPPDVADPIPIPGGLSFRLLGPRKSEIERLQKKHDKYLEDNNLGRESPEAALAAFTDRSVANLASLVVLAEFEGRTILFTGDARGDKILKAMEEQELIERGGAIDVDVLKVPHHGSDRNVTMQFFEQIRADHYVFSGDGHHGNPERAALEMLFEARPEGGYTLHFTYPLATIDQTREAEADHPWIDAIHGLGALMDEVAADGLDITVVEGGATGLRLDLGDPLP